MAIWSALAGFVGVLIWGSFMEWFIHRVGMHTEWISKWSFKRHAIQHHSQRRSLKTFYVPTDKYKIWESSAVPLVWVLHFPLFWLIYAVFNLWAAIGVAVGAALYVGTYEVIHFFIHTPRNYRFQRTRLFHFWCEYHRVHHHRARWNYNVVCPLADYVLRTYTMAELPPEPSAPANLPRHTGPASVFGRPGRPLVAVRAADEE